MKIKVFLLFKVLLLSLFLAACQASGTQGPVEETLVVTETVEATPVETLQVVTTHYGTG